MSNTGASVLQRRRSGEATRRRVMDAVVETVVEIGYYKASSNQIARRAGVTWGAIQHLFGSREQMMLAVAQDIQMAFKERVATAQIDGESLEERLDRIIDVLAEHYEDPSFLVEVQILLDLSVNPGLSADARDELRRTAVEEFTRTAQPLFAQAIGAAAAEQDLVDYALATMVGHLESQQIALLASDRPAQSANRPMLVRALAAFLREEMAGRSPAATTVDEPNLGETGCDDDPDHPKLLLRERAGVADSHGERAEAGVSMPR
jgi:AcrR family transcriptional regulator